MLVRYEAAYIHDFTHLANRHKENAERFCQILRKAGHA
jgi:hypothetical protein